MQALFLDEAHHARPGELREVADLVESERARITGWERRKTARRGNWTHEAPRLCPLGGPSHLRSRVRIGTLDDVSGLGRCLVSDTSVVRCGMATQEVSRELDVPWYGSVFIYCGQCADDRPREGLRRIGKAGGQRFEMVTLDLSEFDTVADEPGAYESLEYVSPFDLDDSADRGTRVKLHKLRTGVLFEVRKNAPRIDYAPFAAEVAERQPQKNSKILDEITKEQLGYQRSTASRGHLALVRLDDDEPGSVLTCWKCGTKASVGREYLVKAVEHVKEFGGSILLFRTGIKVRNFEVPFDEKPRRRKKRPPPRPVSFRRGADFVASGFIPE